ncbi:HipA N-terminal domain-containing protein [Kocuria subflava]|uniref:HipA N-terminal subdomain 1 domain-containing protein n=2 Tax=Kocuria TaxID=57493 RepID=A0A846TUR5_9MICC|nr:HipA N-terminal domain-containing protein [Kocuria subflava]NKE10790.1 hypothetical protein [Kocuria subflava]
MTSDFHQLRQVSTAEVYKSRKLAGTLQRQSDSSTVFTYHTDYVQDHGEPVASTLPVNTTPVVTAGGGLPPFFAGLLPEGHRLTVVRDAVKTSLDDELSLLLAVSADTPGQAQRHLGRCSRSPRPLKARRCVTRSGSCGHGVPCSADSNFAHG